MSLHFKENTTKKNFESKVVGIFGSDHLCANPYVEEGKRMTLYYFKDAHIGTWMSGAGWVFQSAVDGISVA